MGDIAFGRSQWVPQDTGQCGACCVCAAMRGVARGPARQARATSDRNKGKGLGSRGGFRCLFAERLRQAPSDATAGLGGRAAAPPGCMEAGPPDGPCRWLAGRLAAAARGGRACALGSARALRPGGGWWVGLQVQVLMQGCAGQRWAWGRQGAVAHAFCGRCVRKESVLASSTLRQFNTQHPEYAVKTPSVCSNFKGRSQNSGRARGEAKGCCPARARHPYRPQLSSATHTTAWI
jgi:hypothetical protein